MILVFVIALGIAISFEMKSFVLAFLPVAVTMANQCHVVKDMGCFTDSNNRRILSHTAAFGTRPADFPTVCIKNKIKIGEKNNKNKKTAAATTTTEKQLNNHT